MKHNNKLAIVINGRGGVGKDAMCQAATMKFRVRNVSSITPIKEIARQNGWNGEKDLRSRKFLSDLKRIFIAYNDLPTRYLLDEYREFLASDEQILFMHIREADQIAHFVECVDGECITLLITRTEDKVGTSYGNTSDDDVEQYAYDYRYSNDAPLEISEQSFVTFLEQIIAEKGLHL